VPAVKPKEEITAAQLAIGPLPPTPRTRRDYRRLSRWWDLESRRGYASSADSARYAANMRWAADRVGLYGGSATWTEMNLQKPRQLWPRRIPA